jgi:hypothetical protein
MTSQQEADCALALWQAHKGDDQERIHMLLTEFFAQVRADEYEEIQRRVSEIFACPEIIGSPSQSLSSAAF